VSTRSTGVNLNDGGGAATNIVTVPKLVLSDVKIHIILMSSNSILSNCFIVASAISKNRFMTVSYVVAPRTKPVDRS